MMRYYLIFDGHTVTADVEEHGRFTTTRGRFDDEKGTMPGVIRRIVERQYRDMDLELSEDIPHECLVVMYLEISGEGV